MGLGNIDKDIIDSCLFNLFYLSLTCSFPPTNSYTFLFFFFFFLLEIQTLIHAGKQSQKEDVRERKREYHAPKLQRLKYDHSFYLFMYRIH